MLKILLSGWALAAVVFLYFLAVLAIGVLVHGGLRRDRRRFRRAREQVMRMPPGERPRLVLYTNKRVAAGGRHGR